MKRILLAAAILLTVLILAVSSGYIFSIFRTWDEERLHGAIPRLLPADTRPLDHTRRVRLHVDLPLTAYITDARLVLPAAAGLPPAEIRRSMWLWDRWRWRIEASIRPLEPGKMEEGRLEMTIRTSEGTRTVNFPVPAFETTPLTVNENDEARLAGSLYMRHNRLSRWYWVFGTFLCFLAGLGAYMVLRKKRAVDLQIPPWETALAALEKLRATLRRRDATPEAVWTMLNDLVRHYLEIRFELPSRTQTQDEFQQTLADATSPLPPQDRLYLKEFLATSELVKFARSRPDPSLVFDAMDQAEALIRASEIVETTKVKK